MVPGRFFVVATRLAPGRICRDHIAKAQKIADGVAVLPSKVSTKCMPDCVCRTSNPSQKRYADNCAFTIAMASLFAHVIPSFSAPREYQVVMKALLGPPSVFHLGNVVWLIVVVASPVYECDVITPRYFAMPPFMRFVVYVFWTLQPIASQQVSFV